MIKILRPIVYLLLAALVVVGGLELYFSLTDDFRLANISYKLPFKAPWKSEKLSTEDAKALDALLKQKFSYIGKGAQCYAFGSEDGNYVLKFFKFKHLKPNWLMQLMPNSAGKEAYLREKERKLRLVFDAYDLAYREDRQNVGLLYLHLTPMEGFTQHATVLDKMGFERDIDLNSTVFLIQKRGVTLRARLGELLKQNQVVQAQEAIDQILSMYIDEYQRGIYDRDHGVMVNAGFVGSQPFHLDAGKFAKVDAIQSPAIYADDLELILWKIKEWVGETYPHYKSDLSHFMEERYQQLTGRHYAGVKINENYIRARRHLPILNP